MDAFAPGVGSFDARTSVDGPYRGPSQWFLESRTPAVIKANSFEGGTNGVAITTANSGGASGDAFGFISGLAPTFDNTNVHSGSMACSISVGAANTVTCNVGLAGAGQVRTPDSVWCRGYVFVPALPSANIKLIAFENAAGAFIGGLRLTTLGALQMQNAASGTVGTASNAITLSTQVRIEMRITNAAVNGQLEVYAWWTSPESTDYTAADYHDTVTTAVLTDIGVDGSRWGICSNPTSMNAWQIWVDDVQMSTYGWIGPTPAAAPAGTLYTDSGTATVAITASGTESITHADAGTSIVTVTASGTDTIQAVDSGTAQVNFAPSNAEIFGQAADTIPNSGIYPRQTMPGPFQGPASSFQEQRTIYQYVVEPTTSALVSIIASGTDILQAIDANTVLPIITASGTDTAQRVDAGTALPTITASGADVVQRVDTGTAAPHFTASGTDVAVRADAGTVTVGITASGVEGTTRGNPDIPYPDGYTKTPAAKLGPPLGPQGYFQELRTIFQKIVEPTVQATVGITASGVETRSHVDVGTATVGITASGTETAQRVDASTATVAITPSGAEVRTASGPSDDNIGGWFGDVAVGAPGSVTSWTLNFNKTVPSGYLLIVTIVSTAHDSTGVTDSQGNSYTDWDSVSQAGAFIMHVHTYVCQLTTTVTAADTISGTLFGATDCVIVATAYQGVISSSPEDTPARDKTGTLAGTSNLLTATNSTAQAYETLYAAYGLDNRATNLVYDNTYAKRSNHANSSGSRILTITDKTVYSTLTPSTSLSWTNAANAGGILIPIKMAKLPSIVGIQPSGADVEQAVDTGTANLTTTPSFTGTVSFVDTGKALPTFSAAGSSEVKNFRAPDTGMANVSTDGSNSSETFIHSEKATLLVNLTQPFHQDIVQYLDTGTATVGLLITDKSPQLGRFDSCLQTLLQPRWASAPVGARYAAKGFVRYVASVHKRWGTINVGKCP